MPRVLGRRDDVVPGRERSWRVADCVSEFVASEIAVASENLVALVAFVGFVVGVCEQVGFQVGPLVETPLANWTFVRRFFHVKDLVNRQGAGLAKSFSALTTLERFFF